MMIDDANDPCETAANAAVQATKTSAAEAEATYIILPSVTEARATLATKSNNGKRSEIN